MAADVPVIAPAGLPQPGRVRTVRTPEGEDLVRCPAFQGREDAADVRDILVGQKEHVDMLGHDDVSVQQEAQPVLAQGEVVDDDVLGPDWLKEGPAVPTTEGEAAGMVLSLKPPPSHAPMMAPRSPGLQQ